MSWRDIDPSLKKKAVIQLFEEEERDEAELVAWLRGFEGDWILHYLFRRRHTTYLDGLRRLEKKKRIRGEFAGRKSRGESGLMSFEQLRRLRWLRWLRRLR